YAKSILVNVFFGAFFGRVLVDSGIAATLIRKVVELGGDKPRITMSLLCFVTAVIFMSMTGIGPVISIAVIVLQILISLGISVPV
ncbi:citrate transporter, partial [Enterococcus faecium]